MKKFIDNLVGVVVLVLVAYLVAKNLFRMNNSDYLQKARKYGHFTGYKN